MADVPSDRNGFLVPEPNPCIFKTQCKVCKITGLEDRPAMCASIRCEHYSPCKKCGDNKTLTPDKLCSTCTRKHRIHEEVMRDPAGELVVVSEAAVPDLQQNPTIAATDIPARKLSLTSPGIAPPEASEPEKEYYLAQWHEYVNFYRDPTAKAVIHNIILLELELNWLVNWLSISRGQPSKDQESQRTRIIHNLAELHKLLPKKEATDESDDERSMAMIYERYCQEKSKRRLGKVSRIISTEALALAPCMDFKLNPQQLLTNLGYSTIDAIQACDKIQLDDLPADPVRALEFFGFFLNEKYALPMEGELAVMPEIIPEQDIPDETGAYHAEAVAPPSVNDLPVSEVLSAEDFLDA